MDPVLFDRVLGIVVQRAACVPQWKRDNIRAWEQQARGKSMTDLKDDREELTDEQMLEIIDRHEAKEIQITQSLEEMVRQRDQYRISRDEVQKELNGAYSEMATLRDTVKSLRKAIDTIHLALDQ